ncbi:MAG TPA: polysaccharide pyruvyl transferase family protein [Acidimicrobiia bacterium]|nr:polysaccharide pyruvyl transferase family protein [Acidimicrobiia bacterium]
MTGPPDLVAPENDYRSVEPVWGGTEPSVSVVIPAHDRLEALQRTLARLIGQLGPGDEVVVVDDGSEPPIQGLPAGVTLIRQERDGFGLVRARNLGWRRSSGEVVVFLDSDTIPGEAFIARHRGWHAAASNLLVVGLRHHVDASGVSPDELARSGTEGLPRIEEDPEAAITPDWRGWFVRRGALLTLGDEAFRAGVGNNMSLRRHRLEELGGFDDAFRSWGGEDTEFAWRVWNAGGFIVPDEQAAVFHQIEPGERREWRDEARSQNLALVSDRVPHRFYRPRPHPLATVPKLTWVAVASSPGEVETLWKRITAVPFGDVEVVWVVDGQARDVVAALDGHASRVRTAESVGEAVMAARGELVCFADARLRFGINLVAKAVERLDAEPRSSVVRLPYILGPDKYRRLDDLAAADAAHGRRGAPLFAFVRRRELAKDRASLDDPKGMWQQALKRSRIAFLPGDPVSADLQGLDSPSLPGLEEVKAAGPREASRYAIRVARSRLGQTTLPSTEAVLPPTDDRVAIDYVGFTEHDNLGDDAVLVATQRLMPWANLARDQGHARCLMLGGGTLINGNRYYLTRILRRDTPTIERAVFGVGVRDPEFHGVTEPMEEWWRFFDSSLYVGVRGPDSVDHLRHLGYRGEVEVVGDPALSLTPPEVGVDEDSVVVCPVWTSGNLLGGDDRQVFDALAELIRRLVAEGRYVTMMSAFPYDDRHIMALMRHAGHPDLDYVAGYADVDQAMRTLAGAGIVVAERLHAAIMAAAAGRPFVALEYWPKHRDFARSLDLEELVVPTAGLDGTNLISHFTGIDRRRGEVAERIGKGVEQLRRLQRNAAESLRGRLSQADSVSPP